MLSTANANHAEAQVLALQACQTISKELRFDVYLPLSGALRWAIPGRCCRGLKAVAPRYAALHHCRT